MQQVTFPVLRPRVVLGIAAHPDDLDYGAAGTVAAFARRGAAVDYLILTDGGKGSADRNLTSRRLIRTRQSEQRAALRILGGRQVHFLKHSDGGLVNDLGLKREVTRVIRSVKPDVVITMDPSMIYSAAAGFINHPDHRAAGQAALDAVFPLARDHLSFPELLADEGLEPHITPTVLLNHFDRHNYVVDITDSFELKLAALRAHASQVTDPAATAAWVRHMAEQAGAFAGYKLGEAFVRIDLR